MAENPPDWAVRSALKRCDIFPENSSFIEWRDRTYAKAVELLAHMIAKHEEPPVEPLFPKCAEVFGGGQYWSAETIARRLIERGMTITALDTLES